MTDYLQAGDTVVSSEGAHKYTIVRFVGSGASSAAYLADYYPAEGNRIRCIIKEYCPVQMNLRRLPDGTLAVNEDDRPMFEEGCEQFLRACIRQNTIRNEESLTNAVAPLIQTFSANGTVYAQVLHFAGDTMNRMQLTPLQKTELCISIAKWIDTYHRNGLLCLDLKPENIFVMTDGDGSPVTQSVVFIDFDSMRTKAEIAAGELLSCTPEWAAPEQCNLYGNMQISEQTDVFILGELVFWSLFSRHSVRRERRGYSDYDFSDTPVRYRPEVQKLFEELFRQTLRASSKNRCGNMQTILSILQRIAEELRKKEYVLSSVVHQPQRLIGRDEDLRRIQQKIDESPVLFLTGIGGIGKSTTIRAFVSQRRKNYDVILFLTYDTSLQETFRSQVLIAAVEKAQEESAQDYYLRQMQVLRRLTADKRVLFVLDNYTGDPNALPGDLLQSGWHTIIVTRTTPPTCTYPVLELDALDEPAQLRMFSYYLGRECTSQECKDAQRIFQKVGAHTLLIELIARQISESRLTIRQAVSLVQTNGVSHMAQEKVHILKDGQIRYATIHQILSALFNNQDLSEAKLFELSLLSAFDVSGIRIEWLQALAQENCLDELNELRAQGWVQMDGDHVSLHPIILETVRTWPLTNECRNNVLNTLEKVFYLLKSESEKNEYPADLLNKIQSIQSAKKTLPFLQQAIERKAKRNGLPGMIYLHRLAQSNFGERPDTEKKQLYLDTAQRLVVGYRSDSIVREADIYKELSYLAIMNANGEQESFVIEQSSLLLNQQFANPIAQMRILDKIVGFCCARQDFYTAQKYAEMAERLSEIGHNTYLKAVYCNLLATICDARLQGAYDPQTEEEAQLVSDLLHLLHAAIRYAGRSRYGNSGNMRIQYTLSYVNVLIRHCPQDKKEIDRYMQTLPALLDKYSLPYSLNRYWYCMCRGWYYTLVDPDPKKLLILLNEAAEKGEALFRTALEQIDNTLIPAANMMLELGMSDSAFMVLCQAAEVCTEKSELAVYHRKKTELLSCLRDIQNEVDDAARRREIDEKIRSLEQEKE